MRMFTIFQEEKLVTAGILSFLCISLFLRILLGFLYRNMIKEADNMATTENRLLKQCKLKFANCYQLNNGVANIPVFVDKFLNKLKLGPFSFAAIYHISGQSMLLSVICCGVGICKGIADGRTIGEILPYYIVSFLGLYLYFTVSTIVDVKGQRRILKVNLVDYLENHLAARIGVTESDMEMLYGAEPGLRGGTAQFSGTGRRNRYGRRTVELMPINSRDQRDRVLPSDPETAAPSDQLQSFRITDEELEDLLKEFLPT